MEEIKNWIDQGKIVLFYQTPKIAADKGKYTLEVECPDETFYVFADTFEELLEKMKRKKNIGFKLDFEN